MNQLDNYKSALAAIYNYFGFKEGWAVYPIDDRREYFWAIENNRKVVFAKDKNNILWDADNEEYTYPEGCEDSFSDEILKHMHFPKSVYVGPEYTMIMVDTRTDGNKFLAIYDNSKELKTK